MLGVSLYFCMVKNMTQLKPCPRCGCERIRYLACTAAYQCNQCRLKGGNSGSYIKQGYSEREAAAICWNALSKD